MFVIKINGDDSSCHSLAIDAAEQKQRYIDSGISEEDVTVVEKDEFAPPPKE